MKKVLIRFRHGLGDAAQLTIVLKHLKHYHSDWVIDVESLVGKHSCFHGLCNASYRMKRDPVNANQYDQVFELHWFNPSGMPRSNVPATKVTKALVEVFKLQPIPEFYYYDIPVSQEENKLAQTYLNKLPQKKGFVTIHYQGNTSGWNKNIGEEAIRKVTKAVIAAGYIVIILDWDSRSNLPNTRTIFCPGKKDKIWKNTGTGDGATIAALITKSTLFIGIDSGPLHVAGATSTPSIGVWKKHHPLNFFDLSHNVKHLLPRDHHPILIAEDKKKATEYFEQNYQFCYYGNLSKVLLKEVRKSLHIDSDADDSGYREKDAQIILMNNWFGLGKEKNSTFVLPHKSTTIP